MEEEGEADKVTEAKAGDKLIGTQDRWWQVREYN